MEFGPCYRWLKKFPLCEVGSTWDPKPETKSGRQLAPAVGTLSCTYSANTYRPLLPYVLYWKAGVGARILIPSWKGGREGGQILYSRPVFKWDLQFKVVC